MESNEMLSRHFEAGAWWDYEPYQEFRAYMDGKQIRRQEVVRHPSLGSVFVSGHQPAPYIADNTEEHSIRLRKIRDEKVARACGLVETPRLPTLVPACRDYAALHVYSGYAFGRGTMLAEEVPAFAAAAGIPAVALTDPFALTGAVEFAKIAKRVGVKPLIGSGIELPEGGEIVLLARTAQGYRNLSRLITECHLDEPRLFPLANWERLARHAGGLLCLTGGATSLLNWYIAQERYSDARTLLTRLISLYGRGHVFVEIERSFFPHEEVINERLLSLAESMQVKVVAGGAVTHSRRRHFPVQDMIACIHSLCTIDGVLERKLLRHPDQPQGREIPRRALNAERFLKSPREMAELYADRPDLLDNTLLVASLCEENVLPERAVPPSFCDDESAMLRELVYAGLKKRALEANGGFRRRIEQELDRINRLGFAGHFLIAWDMCEWCRKQRIHFSARGSVVDSVIAYCLGISRINAYEHNLFFDRFLPNDGSKRPDIDIDFEAKRRDDVREYLGGKYGKENVATVSAIGTFSTRGIVREVAKVMGLPNEAIGYLAKRIHGGVSPKELEAALKKRPELQKSGIPTEWFRWVFRLSERMTDLPRNMRSHSSGVVISNVPIRDLVPLMISGKESVPIIQWDKRSAKYFFDKFDVLCLRGHDVLSQTEESIRLRDVDFCVQDVPIDQKETYSAFQKGHLVGIPQSASPAMRQAHIRLRTRNLTEASFVQAGIRPGVGGAVNLNEFIARHLGKAYTIDHPDMRDILGHTYGLIIFQEQVDQLLQKFCGYTSGEAEDIREAIYKRRREKFAEQVRNEILTRIVDNGYPQAVAEQVYGLVSQFQGYGFSEGHALAFAEMSVRCVYCQQNYPTEYFAAILNAQPAGYYGPATLVNEARGRGVKILGVDVNRSGIQFAAEDIQAEDDPRIIIPNGGIRVGLFQIGNLSKAAQERIVAEQPYSSFFDFVSRVRPERDELEQLILCGAFDSLHPNRRALLWSIPQAMDLSSLHRALDANALPLCTREPKYVRDVEDFSPIERAYQDRRILSLDVERHLLAFERERVREKGGITSKEASELTPGTTAFVVGNPIRLRFPPTRSGKRVVFFDLEDETGLLNVTCFDDTYLRDGHAIVCSPYVTVSGVAQDRDGHTAFLAKRVHAYTPGLRPVLVDERALATADFLVG